MNEKLINEYINNLANRVNALTQENILLQTRLTLLEKEQQERQVMEEKETEYSTPEPDPESEINGAPFIAPQSEPEPEPEPEPTPDIPPLVKGPKPKGYNPKVDGPIPLIPNPALQQE